METAVNKDIQAKAAKKLGQTAPESLINLKTAKYKDPTEVIRY